MFFFSSRRRHTRYIGDWSSDVCSSDLALLPGPEQVDGERYEQGSRIKAVIREVRTGTKGPQVILSRRDPELIKTLFELERSEERRVGKESKLRRVKRLKKKRRRSSVQC